MTEPAERLAPTDPRDLADALAFALRFQGRKRVHNADELMAAIVARHLVEHLEGAGFVPMRRDRGGGAGRCISDLRNCPPYRRSSPQIPPFATPSGNKNLSIGPCCKYPRSKFGRKV